MAALMPIRGERMILSGVPFSYAIFFDPQLAAGGEVPGVVTAVDRQRLAEPRRAAGQVEHVLHAAPRVHQRQAIERLDGADQDGAAQADVFRHAVEAPPGVDHIDVGVPRRAEHRRVAPRHSAIRVASRIAAAQVGFGFDDPPAAEALRRLPHQPLADQLAGDNGRMAGIERSGQQVCAEHGIA